MVFKQPEPNEESFTCPHCGVLAMQTWSTLMTNFSNRGGWSAQPNMFVGKCDHCFQITIWLDSTLISPESMNIHKPNEDLDEYIQKDYNEAASIVEKSPKAAAALLRLGIQKLCKQLGEEGSNINKDISELVKKGLPIQIQQALDIVRVVGNESVHPGQIDLDDNKEIALKLFELINIIAQTMITQPKEIGKLYSSLPKEKLDGIAKRDSK